MPPARPTQYGGGANSFPVYGPLRSQIHPLAAISCRRTAIQPVRASSSRILPVFLSERFTR